MTVSENRSVLIEEINAGVQVSSPKQPCSVWHEADGGDFVFLERSEDVVQHDSIQREDNAKSPQGLAKGEEGDAPTEVQRQLHPPFFDVCFQPFVPDASHGDADEDVEDAPHDGEGGIGRREPWLEQEGIPFYESIFLEKGRGGPH